MKFFVFIASFLFFAASYGQVDILYDLDSYKNVDYNRSAMDLQPNAQISASDRVNIPGEDANFDVNLSASLSTSEVRNSRSEQVSNYQLGRLAINEGYTLDYLRRSSKRSYDGHNNFTLFEYQVRPYIRRHSNDDYTNMNLAVDITAGLGRGRLEVVNNAWHAGQQFQMLENEGELLRIPSTDEIQELSIILDNLLNVRFYDFRLNRLRVLEALGEWLSSNGFIKENSIRSMLILYDTYNFERTKLRYSGSRIEYSITQEYVPTYERNVGLSETFLEWEVGGMINWRSYKNPDVKWMKMTNTGIKLVYDSDAIRMTTGDDEGSSRLSTFYEYGYYWLPNLRNSLSLTVDLEAFMDIRFSEEPTSFSEVEFTAAINADYIRYISPRTRFELRGFFGYFDSELQAGVFQPSLNSSLSVKLFHSIY